MNKNIYTIKEEIEINEIITVKVPKYTTRLYYGVIPKATSLDLDWNGLKEFFREDYTIFTHKEFIWLNYDVKLFKSEFVKATLKRTYSVITYNLTIQDLQEKLPYEQYLEFIRDNENKKV